jgi:hypothetical protein
MKISKNLKIGKKVLRIKMIKIYFPDLIPKMGRLK